MSSTSRIARLAPETAIRCVRSVAWNTSCSSGVTREVSPTTSPGNSARASGSSPSVAVRSPARRPPAARWRRVGGPMTRGGPLPSGRRTAALRSPLCRGGERRPLRRSRVDGSSRCHCAAERSGDTITSTGTRSRVTAPSGAVTRMISASRRRATGVLWSPRTWVRVCRASDVTVTSASTFAKRCARPGTGCCRRSALCSPAAVAPAAAHSRAAAAAVACSRRRPYGALPAVPSVPLAGRPGARGPGRRCP